MSETPRPSAAPMPPAFDPHAIEQRWFDFWTERGYFVAPRREGEKPFCIVIPPPNVTGSLHMGHALNNTIQDVVIRRHRMMGEPTLWLPGTDHAGIATQNKVEQQLAEEGLSRHDVTREEFIERVWVWKEKYGSTIIHQLKKMGCSCDYSRERFTMDEGYSKAVKRVFVELHGQGLIYRGLRLINWCPRCHTALSDIEVEHEDRHSTLYYVRYPVEDGGESGGSGKGGRGGKRGPETKFIEVATVRPESMLGDTAVAVSPDDDRYRDLVGKTAILPLVDRELPIIADSYVDPAFGTGAVKITPAHDPNDYDMAERHGLAKINILTEDGHINEEGGRFAGMERFEAREAVVAALDDEGYLVKTEDYEHSVGTCYRCHTIIEPYLSEQWFVDMKPLAAPAIECVKEGPDGAPARVRFVPERWKRIYVDWMENIRDWCVSRQIWWGHQIPAWYCECGEIVVAEDTPSSCPKCGDEALVQDEDVLDTWFSSALWPFATLGWPDETEDLAYFYPTSVLSTARDILYLWVARMIMTGLRFMDDVPYDTVIIHQTVLNFEGRRMSKSLGTGVDPLDLMEKYGADAMRYGLMLQATQAQDMRFTEDKLEASRNFCNKIWNAARLVLGAVGDEIPMPGKNGEVVDGYAGFVTGDGLADRWILSRLAVTVADVDLALGGDGTPDHPGYEFGDATRRLHDFFWGDYCDWYLESVKPALRGERGDTDGEKSDAKTAAQGNLLFVMDVALRLLHPFMPFITEELWQRLPRMAGLDDSTPADDALMMAAWPNHEAFADWRDGVAEERVEAVQQLLGTGVRSVRSAFDVAPKTQVDLYVRTDDQEAFDDLDEALGYFKHVAGVGSVFRLGAAEAQPEASGSGVIAGWEHFVSVASVDLGAARARLTKALAETEKDLTVTQKKLANPAFTDKAPPDVVEKQRAKQAELTDRREKLTAQLAQLG
jgi:valyl-tRNA synthetase